MGLPILMMVAVGLAMDAFAVSVSTAIAVERVRVGHVLRLSIAFGLFQFGMPVIGWTAGRHLSRFICGWDHWVAFGLLVVIGAKMLIESFSHKDEPRSDPSRGWMLLVLAIATSIDALAVGLSLAFLGVDVWIPSLVIGVVAATLSAAGVLLGKLVGSRLGHYGEAVGGCVLIGIGIKVLVEHLFT